MMASGNIVFNRYDILRDSAFDFLKMDLLAHIAISPEYLFSSGSSDASDSAALFSDASVRKAVRENSNRIMRMVYDPGLDLPQKFDKWVEADKNLIATAARADWELQINQYIDRIPLEVGEAKNNVIRYNLQAQPIPELEVQESEKKVVREQTHESVNARLLKILEAGYAPDLTFPYLDERSKAFSSTLKKACERTLEGLSAEQRRDTLLDTLSKLRGHRNLSSTIFVEVLFASLDGKEDAVEVLTKARRYLFGNHHYGAIKFCDGKIASFQKIVPVLPGGGGVAGGNGATEKLDPK